MVYCPVNTPPLMHVSPTHQFQALFFSLFSGYKDHYVFPLLKTNLAASNVHPLPCNFARDRPKGKIVIWLALDSQMRQMTQVKHVKLKKIIKKMKWTTILL